MKTAISVPDETFTRVDQLAADHGLSRSEFYTQAAQRLAEQMEAQSLTHDIDAALTLIGLDDSTIQDVVKAGRRHLSQIEDQW